LRAGLTAWSNWREKFNLAFQGLIFGIEAADLSVPEAVQTLLRQLEARGVQIDVLVNNAGLGESELFERSPWSRIEQIVEVNIMAILRVSHHLLPAMLNRGHGAILNIGSGAGYAAMPNAAVYTASKHFVRAFTESSVLNLLVPESACQKPRQDRSNVSSTRLPVSRAAPPQGKAFSESPHRNARQI
jgi:NAD(P)-dependent dehydrogenase (short-subunit alcohol dehydrogenase family)